MPLFVWLLNPQAVTGCSIACLRGYLFIRLLEQCHVPPVGTVRGWKSTCSSDYDRVPFSLRDSRCLFSTLSVCSSPSSLSLFWSSYHAHPFHDYAQFSVLTFHFDFPELPARCQTCSSYWIARRFFFSRLILFFSLILSARENSTTPLIAFRDLSQTAPLFRSRPIVRLGRTWSRRWFEIVRRATSTKLSDVLHCSRMLRALYPATISKSMERDRIR